MVTVTSDQLLTACACRSFAASVAAASPFSSMEALLSHARDVWYTQVRQPCLTTTRDTHPQTPVAGWLEAFAAHPRIGDLESLRTKYGAFADLSKGEQAAAAASATDDVLKQLQAWNARYEAKFGHIFIICAKGKRADEMLQAVKTRYNNAPLSELANAAGQQMAITELRLRDMLATATPPTGASVQRRAGHLLTQLRPGNGGATRYIFWCAACNAAPTGTTTDGTGQPRTRSPITTHVLDTAMGRPAQGVPVQLFYLEQGSQWVLIGAGATNRDGRCVGV